MIKNKHGDITITILVLGVILICVLAITSFFMSNNSVKRSFSSVDSVVESSLIKEKVSFYKNLGFDKEQIKSLLSLQEDPQGNIIIDQPGVSVVFAWP